MNDLLEIDDNDFYSFDEEEISLTEEQIAEAVRISDPVTNRELQWQVYMSALALAGFTSWLDERDDELKIDTTECKLLSGSPQIAAADRLQIGGFKLCVVAKGALDGDVVNIPHALVQNPAEAAHFYVVVEVLEEMAQALMYGFIRYDRLQQYLKAEPLERFSDGTCDLPVGWLNLEFDELLSYLRCFNPSAVPLPTTKKLPTIISEWLEGVIQTGWQTIEQLESLVNVNTPTFAFRGFRDETTPLQSTASRFGKIFVLGVENQKQSVALVVEVSPIPNEDRTYIRIKVQPTDRDYLPLDLQLSILGESGTNMSEVRSKSLDDFIQLGFKKSTGSTFAVKIELDNSQIIEEFVI
jgi:hypothetical protein